MAGSETASRSMERRSGQREVTRTYDQLVADRERAQEQMEAES